MKTRALKMWLLTIGVLSLVWTGSVLSGVVQAQDAGQLAVNIEPVKEAFKVGERIRFRVWGNQTFYLYLFSIDSQADKGYVILPNKLQQYHKYQPGRTYIVPEKNLEFYSDRPGPERVVMVAVTKKLKLDLSHLTQTGTFLAGQAQEVEDQVKALRVRTRQTQANEVVKEISVNIVGQGSRAPALGRSCLASNLKAGN